MTHRTLREVYAELQLEEYVELGDFLARVQAGEFGDFSREDCVVFLQQVERDMLANIETQLEAHPHWEPLREQAMANVQQTIQGLIDKLSEEV